MTRMSRGLAVAIAVVTGCATVPADARDRLVERAGQFVLDRPLADFYDTAFVLTDAGRHPPRVVGVDELAAALVHYDVVFFGESHRHPGVHRQQQALFRALHQRHPRWILSLEQFERDVQGVVDDYLAGRIGEKTLIDRGRAWDNYQTSYRPLVSYAKDHRLPVIAAEAPVWSVVCVGQFGTEILDRFTPLERSWVAQDLHVTPGAYRDKYRRFESGATTHGGGGAATPEAQLRSDRSYAGQVVRDDTMAESIDRARRKYPGHKVLHLNGSFHSAGFLGTVERLRLRDPSLRIAVIDPVEVDDRQAPSFGRDRLSDGTALQLVYPAPEDFLPGEDQTDYVRSIIAKRKANPCKYAPPGQAPVAPDVPASAADPPADGVERAGARPART